LALGQQADDLFGGVVPSLHCRAVLHPTIVGLGLAQRVDQPKGTRSNPAGHREVDYDDVTETAEAVGTASLLMRILDRVEQRLAG
ncbi:MAG TPA: hypothetical protein VKV36_00445, partial [Acidimicrobiales bacterium]|nr:hypothetical protein [Acidimicrobiales bacterium]